MVHLCWNKLSEKQKQYIRSVSDKSFILGMASVSIQKLRGTVLKELENNRLVIVGDLAEDYVDGLEQGAQFKKIDADQVTKLLSSFDKKYQNLLIHITYSKNDIKYILREFKPNRMIGFYGSWNGVLHYNPIYWECIRNSIDVYTDSPFDSECEIIEHTDKINSLNYINFKKTWEGIDFNKYSFDQKYSFNVDEVVRFCKDVATLSWDWTGRTGACLTYESEKRKTKNEKLLGGVWNLNQIKGEFSKEDEFKVIAFGQNKVSPFEGYTLLNGSKREKDFSELGKNAELMESVHAEVHAIINAFKMVCDLSKATLWVTKCPCSVCARIIREAGISRVIYFDEYENSDVFQVISNK